ncbi:MAG: type II toxin-antitoxin system HicA family toxin [Tepidiformaceae bacterium]
MSTLEKSIARLLANPPEADFNDVRRVLKAHGWVQARQQGSHVHFTKEGERTITVPLRGKMVWRHYVREICTRLGLAHD